ncbi:MAG TPA: serpin family protein [Bacteroidales bacterium]|nr:serpin family protein [Bacteroidales bacterium]
MKKLFLYLISTLCVVSLLNSCADQITTPDDSNHEDYVPIGGSGPILLRSALMPQATRDNGFALKMFRQMAVGSNDSNIVISPFSISIALGMAWNGADLATKDEMTNLLGMNEMPDSLVNQYYEVMQKSLPVADSSTTVNIANSLWYTTDFTVKPSYLKLNQDYFDAEIHSIDFKQSWAKDTINAWVDNKTNHLIPTIIQSTWNQKMFLINAVYFKGAWVMPFDPDITMKTTFTKQLGGTTQVNTMSMLDTVRYGETSDAQYLDLAYGNGAYSMTLVLPKSGYTTSTVLSALTPELFNATLLSLNTQKVQVYMPRFKVECDFNLIPTLKSLGMKLAFTDLANFSGISTEPLMISDVKHKTYVEVTEKGTTAAAVTSIGFVTTSMPNYPIFNANKPFLFFIRENGSKVILFAGKIANVELF